MMKKGGFYSEYTWQANNLLCLNALKMLPYQRYVLER
ncbi:hypothetical protein EC835_103233 [Providencia alcalifaciens]|uniref:Uncharacterized protein n=1 Tax=Providencia alcalifaciens TaxID=126385 RepID=A0A4R3NTT8_9GAMM|nr:hypothetical protein EC835_103233 [Providencia alcalifaciens]